MQFHIIIFYSCFGQNLQSQSIDSKGLSEAEKNISTHGHRQVGESSQSATCRVKEDITNAIKEEQVTCDVVSYQCRFVFCVCCYVFHFAVFL